MSGGGTDAGTCERTAPCRTFGYAITQTNAKGEIVAIDSSGYGPVTITKSISLIAPKGVHAGISPSSGNAITSTRARDKVVIKNLYLNGGNGAGNGIVANTAGAVEVDDTTAAVRDRWDVPGTARQQPHAAVSVSDSVTRDNGATGLAFVGSSGGRSPSRSTTSAAPATAYGFARRVRGTVTDSITSRNARAAFSWADGSADPARSGSSASPPRATASGCTPWCGAKITASDSTIEYNNTGLVADTGGQLVSRVNNTLTENGTDGAFTSTIAAAYRAPRN